MARRVITVFLTLACIIMLFGCTNAEQADETTGYDGETVDFSVGELSAYQIMRSDLAESVEIGAAIKLRDALKEIAGVTLTTDWVKRGEEIPSTGKEILVGQTNRQETAELTKGLRLDDFVIGRSGERIVIAGGGEEATEKAVEFFISNFVDAETKTVALPAETYVHAAEYQIDELKLNGTPISECQLKYEGTGADAAMNNFSESIADLTGYTLSGTERTIIFRIGGEADDNCRISSDGDAIIIEAGDKDGIITAEKYFLAGVIGTESLEDGKNGALLDINITEETVFDMNEIAKREPERIYVSTAGDDLASGVEAAPLKTLAAALESAKSKKSKILAPIEIILQSGDYYVGETLELDESYSGTKYSPLTIKAAESGKVNLIGGLKIDSSLTKKVTDEAILSRLADQNAADKLMMLDLSGVIDEIPEICTYGMTGDAKYPLEIYFGEQSLTRSRWPNDVSGSAYLRTSNKLEYTDYQTMPLTFGYIDGEDHATKYWTDETVKNLYIFGYLAYDWYNDSVKVQSLDFDSKTVVTESGVTYEPNTGTRFYFYNLIEEIDQPGESYIDRENRVVYYYPYENVSDDIYVSTLVGPMLSFSGSKYTTLDGINFLYSRGMAVQSSEAGHFTVKNCTVAHNSHMAMALSGSNITVDGCVIYDTAAGGISISGGDRTELISGESVIKNCVIHDINRSQETYKPGVMAGSVGLVIRNNTFYNSTHEMIAVGTNDVVIQYNEFYNCVTESADMGAIYYGRNPSILGTDIGYNYFHDIGNPYGGIGQQSIFIDDGSIGAYIHDNVFERATFDSAAVKAHGAQYSLIENNVFADMPAAMFNADWSDSSGVKQLRWWLWLYDRYPANAHEIWQKMTAVNFESDIWHEHYDGTIWECVWYDISSEMHDKVNSPEYADDAALRELGLENAPYLTNRLTGNVYFNIAETEKSGNIYNGGKVDYKDNAAVTESDFISYGENYALTDDALSRVRETIPDFRNIDMSKLGPGGNE